MNNIDFSHITENRLKNQRAKFDKYEELTEEWEQAHADHTPTKYKHTVLKDGKGVEFECLKCYLCGVMAHREVSFVQKNPEKFVKEKKTKIFKDRKVNREVAGFHMLPGD